jgi:hypothetical protein
LVRVANVLPSSVVSKMPMPWTIAYQWSAPSGCWMIAGTPRWPGGWFAGSFHDSRAGWPSIVDSSDHVAPPSRLSKTPGASTPAKMRPFAAVRPEILETFSGPSP